MGASTSFTALVGWAVSDSSRMSDSGSESSSISSNDFFEGSSSGESAAEEQQVAGCESASEHGGSDKAESEATGEASDGNGDDGDRDDDDRNDDNWFWLRVSCQFPNIAKAPLRDARGKSANGYSGGITMNIFRKTPRIWGTSFFLS